MAGPTRVPDHRDEAGREEPCQKGEEPPMNAPIQFLADHGAKLAMGVTGGGWKVSTLAACGLAVAILGAILGVEGVGAQELGAAEGGKRAWGPEQATGAPDTPEAGDFETAWASKTPDDQEEWLILTFTETVIPAAALIYESFNPGAVSSHEKVGDGGLEPAASGVFDLT